MTEHRVVRPDPGDGRGPSRELCACAAGFDHDPAGVPAPLRWPARDFPPPHVGRIGSKHPNVTTEVA